MGESGSTIKSAHSNKTVKAVSDEARKRRNRTKLSIERRKSELTGHLDTLTWTLRHGKEEIDQLENSSGS